jgi:hypothetical protein
MLIYDSTNIPEAVGVERWIRNWRRGSRRVRRSGADVPIAQRPRDHRQLGAGPRPPIEAVDTLVLRDRTGRSRSAVTRPARRRTPSGALVYIHGGGVHIRHTR